ncbi:MAG: ParB/RepB/Spo0J family partition protein [Spiroplasma sp. WSS]|uniref:ParB/RepB/Spo0J family partition protein n=1 Tax=unclassified Spiroplasma TaxID=2637901 RepID=UPI001219C953|nr:MULTISPECIES: ParB/RepB/Spo0J family partition protein [unclassified Spiroplasma]TLF25060.1 MAG: ParB/RepB/Spo0J family partition protein [Spiroplasma sp. WSS]
MSNDKKNRISAKGLASIFGEGLNDLITNIESSPEIAKTFSQTISLAKIIPNPYQPRVVFNEQEIKELSDSIKIHGLIQPIIVKKTITDGVFQLVAGERRTKAAKLAGLTEISAVTIEVTDQQLMEFALIENIQRVDLNAFEEAQAYQTLISKMKWTQEQLSQKVNKSRSHIANTLRILQLPVEILQMLQRNELTMGHVKPLLSLGTNLNLMVTIAKRAYSEQWSVRKVEDVIKMQQLSLNQKQNVNKKSDLHLVALENTLSRTLDTKVKINKKQLIINYSNHKELNRILEFLKLI